MSKISLRDYNHEIEGLINSGKTDEAIAHSKYILRLFPKCVDTYRLLGKAYLEAQRYSEATDILIRILSVVPDDFVSQIGMSIIREDEGNLDAAIYHMERAFEVKPSNSAIQDELRRLYGRRDGITPPRVRLTRGALVRMYARGELYPQAIAEIRASLAEDPKRVDLEVILANIYMVLGRKAEAIEVCSRLVNKLPNCLEANRILAEVLPGTSRAEDAETYRQRVIALDPYFANITSSTPTSNEVPDNAIQLDFLEYQPSQPGSQQPEWANSVGVNLQEPEEAIPDWLVEKPAGQAPGLPEPPPPPVQQPEPAAPPAVSEQKTAEPVSEPVQQAPGELSENDELIPDWMKSAGWAEAATNAAEVKESAVPSSAEAGEPPEEIAHAELPDWLKAIAPDQGTQAPPSVNEEEDLARLGQLLTSQPQQPEQTNQPTPVEPAPSAPVEAIATPQEAQPEVKLPDWLGEQTTTQAPAAASQPAGQEEVPDWLAGLNIPSETAETAPAPAEATPTEELPDWLKTFAPEASSEAAAEPVSETSQDWFKDLQATTQPAGTPETPVSETPPQAEQPMPDWLRGLGEEVPAAAEIAAATPVEPQAEIAAAPVEAAVTPEKAETPVSETTPQAEEPMPDWLRGLGEEIPAAGEITTAAPAEAALIPEQIETPASEATPQAEEPMPDWLRGLGEEIPAAGEIAAAAPVEAALFPEKTETPASETTPQAEEPMPDWLRGLGEEIPAAAQVEPVAESPAVPAEPALPPETIATSPQAEEPMPDWLRGLGEEQPPVSETAEAIPAEAAITAETTEVPVSETTPQAEEPLPDWLLGLGEEIAAANEVAAAAPVEPVAEIPAVPVETRVLPEAEAVAPAAKSEEFAAEEPAAKTQPVAVVKPELPAEQPPAQPAEPVTVQEPALEPVAAQPAPDDIDAALAWLESLAVQQGADQDTLSVSAEQRTQTPPEWVRKEIESAKAAAEAAPAEAEAEAPAAPEVQPVPEAEVETPAPVAEQIPAVEEILQPAVAEQVEPAEIAAAPVEVPVEEIAGQEVVPAAEAAAPSMVNPEEMDLDAAFAWLESLAARQGAESETLSASTEAQQEQATAWIPPAAEVEETEPAAEITPAVEAAAAEEPAFEPAFPAEPVAEVEIPEAVTPAPEAPVAAEIPAEAAAEEEPLPDWLKGVETPAAETPAPAPSAVSGESVSIWLKNIQVPEEETAGMVAEQPTEAAPEEPLPDWLQGIEHVSAVPVEPPAPVKESAEELPDWMQEPEAAAQEKTEAPVEEGLPEWLRGLETTAETEEPLVIPVEPVAEEMVPAAELPQEQPLEVEPVEAPAPVAEEVSQVTASFEQEVQAEPVEEIPQPVVTPTAEEKPAEMVPVMEGADTAQVLAEAQRNLDAGDLDRALPHYTRLIESHVHLEEIIRDLQNALYRRPVDVALHETLGDAYAQSNRLQDALDTYTKAEELLVK